MRKILFALLALPFCLCAAFAQRTPQDAQNVLAKVRAFKPLTLQEALNGYAVTPDTYGYDKNSVEVQIMRTAQKIVKDNPNSYVANLNYGMLLTGGDYEYGMQCVDMPTARKHLDKALALRPNSLPALEVRAILVSYELGLFQPPFWDQQDVNYIVQHATAQAKAKKSENKARRVLNDYRRLIALGKKEAHFYWQVADLQEAFGDKERAKTNRKIGNEIYAQWEEKSKREAAAREAQAQALKQSLSKSAAQKPAKKKDRWERDAAGFIIWSNRWAR